MAGTTGLEHATSRLTGSGLGTPLAIDCLGPQIG